MMPEMRRCVNVSFTRRLQSKQERLHMRDRAANVSYSGESLLDVEWCTP
jgi:hypothetical protein